MSYFIRLIKHAVPWVLSAPLESVGGCIQQPGYCNCYLTGSILASSSPLAPHVVTTAPKWILCCPSPVRCSDFQSGFPEFLWSGGEPLGVHQPHCDSPPADNAGHAGGDCLLRPSPLPLTATYILRPPPPGGATCSVRASCRTLTGEGRRPGQGQELV